MGDILTFRPRASYAHVPPAPSPAETRRVIEEAAQAALDTADSLLAILDRMDGEDAGEAVPVAVTAERSGGKGVALRKNDAVREAEAPAVVLQFVSEEASALPWRGSGNVVAAAGVAILEMVAGR